MRRPRCINQLPHQLLLPQQSLPRRHPPMHRHCKRMCPHFSTSSTGKIIRPCVCVWREGEREMVANTSLRLAWSMTPSLTTSSAGLTTAPPSLSTVKKTLPAKCYRDSSSTTNSRRLSDSSTCTASTKCPICSKACSRQTASQSDGSLAILISSAISQIFYCWSLAKRDPTRTKRKSPTWICSTF